MASSPNKTLICMHVCMYDNPDNPLSMVHSAAVLGVSLEAYIFAVTDINWSYIQQTTRYWIPSKMSTSVSAGRAWWFSSELIRTQHHIWTTSKHQSAQLPFPHQSLHTDGQSHDLRCRSHDRGRESHDGWPWWHQASCCGLSLTPKVNKTIWSVKIKATP